MDEYNPEIEDEENKNQRETPKQASKRAFRQALIDNEGFVSKAADQCDMARSTAISWIKKDKRLQRLIKELRHTRRYG